MDTLNHITLNGVTKYVKDSAGQAMLAPEELTLTAANAYAVGDLFRYDGKLYKASVAIAVGDTIEVGTNCEETTIAGENIRDVQVAGQSVVVDGVAVIPDAALNRRGVVSVGNNTSTSTGIYRVGAQNMLYINPATSSLIKNPSSSDRSPIIPYNQHESTFYGLAKAAGSDEKGSTLPVGQYTESAKGAIQKMLGVSDLIAPEENDLVASKAYAIGDVFTANGKLYKATVAIAANDSIVLQNEGETVSGANAEECKVTDYAVHDVQINGTSILSNGTVNIQPQNGYGIGVDAHDYSKLVLIEATDYEMRVGGGHRALTGTNQYKATFYGLAKAAGDTTQSQSNNAVGTYTDDAKTAIRTMLGAVGTEEYANTSTAGVVKVSLNNGSQMINGVLTSVNASAAEIKTGVSSYKQINPGTVDAAAFYGLAKASGDTTQSSSSNAVGTYTDNAKASIKAMLGIQDGSTGTVDVTGTTPTITAVENTRYVCGEVTSLNFTPAASGICIVRFTSGSTVTVLTLPSTVKFPEWFDPTSLETNTIYEICITDGVYGAVMSWVL